MKHWLTLIGCSLALSLPLAAEARKSDLKLSIEEAMASADAKDKLGSDIKFFFGKQKTPKILEQFGEASTMKNTNAFNKSDEAACQWAFLSAMIALKERAEKEGANAVVNIRTRNTHIDNSSSTEYECSAGNVVARVSLTGKFVKIAQ